MKAFQQKNLYKEEEIIELKKSKLNEKIILKNIWPKIYMQNIKYLDLSSNKIKNIFFFINNKAFCIFEGFESLEYLDLSKNPIKETHAKNFGSLKNLKTLKLTNTEISKEHYFRCIKKLDILENLTLKYHKVFKLTLKGLTKQIGKKLSLTSLDWRFINEKQNLLLQKENKIIITYFPNIKTYNGKSISSLIKKSNQLKVEKKYLKNRRTPNLMSRKSIFNKFQKNLQKTPQVKKTFFKSKKRNEERSISNISRSDIKLYDSDDSFLGKKSNIDFNQSFDFKDRSSDKKTMRNFINVFHEKLNLDNKENTPKNKGKKIKIEKYRDVFSRKLA